jgi:hypothetical protein
VIRNRFGRNRSVCGVQNLSRQMAGTFFCRDLDNWLNGAARVRADTGAEGEAARGCSAYAGSNQGAPNALCRSLCGGSWALSMNFLMPAAETADCRSCRPPGSSAGPSCGGLCRRGEKPCCLRPRRVPDHAALRPDMMNRNDSKALPSFISAQFHAFWPRPRPNRALIRSLHRDRAQSFWSRRSDPAGSAVTLLPTSSSFAIHLEFLESLGLTRDASLQR